MQDSRERVMGYSVYSRSPVHCAAEVLDCIAERSSECRLIACLNPHSYVMARTRPSFRAALDNSTWLLPDGVGITAASVLGGGRIHRRITGYDIFLSVNRLLDQRGGGKVFFLGSTYRVLDQIMTRFRTDFPNTVVAGVYSPPYKPRFSEEENREMIHCINAANPDLLWVGMTAPKQERWLYHNRNELSVPIAGAIGAVFDFYAGTVRRSPRLFQRLGLEWLPRLVQQPGRLWRRTFISGPIFVTALIKSLLFRQ